MSRNLFACAILGSIAGCSIPNAQQVVVPAAESVEGRHEQTAKSLPADAKTHLAKEETLALPTDGLAETAKGLFENRAWLALVEHCQRWTKVEPWNFSAWAFLGASYFLTDQFSKAAEALQQAVRLKPDSGEAWYGLALGYAESRQLEKAEEALQRAILLKPALANQDSLAAHTDSSPNLDAVEAIRQALRHTLAKGFYGMGFVYVKSGQLAKAIEAFKQAVRLDPDWAEAWHYLGVLYVNVGQPAKAIAPLQQALRLKPDWSRPWGVLGDAYALTNQRAKAIEAFKQALRLEPDWAEPWGVIGEVYLELGQLNKAIDALEQTIRLKPDWAKAWHLLGIAYKLLGQNDKVIETYKRLKQLDSTLADEFFRKAVLP